MNMRMDKLDMELGDSMPFDPGPGSLTADETGGDAVVLHELEGLVWSPAEEGGQGEVMEILTDIARNKTPVRVEIEGEHTRFRSQLTLKEGMVVIAKPGTLMDTLSVGSHVRVSVPGSEARQLRMEVSNSHFNLSNGNAVFVCFPPEPPPQPSRRNHQRYDVSRFNNLLLYLPGMDGFRLVDISATGLKLLTASGEALKIFPLGGSMSAAHIQLGASARVDLETLIPRQHYVQTVGCEFQVMADGISSRYLNHLLASLDKAQSHRLQI